MTSADIKFKIVLVGDSGVGKTCIFNQFKQRGNFVPTQTTFNMNSAHKSQRACGKNIDLELWDTAGVGLSKNQTSTYYSNVQCLILVYDISSRQSFNSLDQWYSDMWQHVENLDTVFRVLIGNKSDQTRVVEYCEGKRFAEQNRFQIFNETCARFPDHIEELFNELGLVLTKKEMSAAKPEYSIRSQPEPKSMIQVKQPVNREIGFPITEADSGSVVMNPYTRNQNLTISTIPTQRQMPEDDDDDDDDDCCCCCCCCCWCCRCISACFSACLYKFIY